VLVPPSNDPIVLDIDEVKEAQSQRLIFSGVKDPLIPHLVKKKITKEMWEALKNIYEAKNENCKMKLKDKLHSIKMTNGESVVPYLTRLAQVKDELTSVGKFISD
jgi:2-phosphoglycerate kinase